MPNFFLKHKKVIASLSLILAVSAFGIFVFGVGEAQAIWPFGTLIDMAFDGVAWIIVKIGVIPHAIASLFFWFASMVLEMAISIESFTDASVVQIGWKITRDIANMLFVIGLIIIAGATALKIESYDIKKLLPKLIIAALLINFSLVIAGVVIDFTQVAAHFFYDAIGIKEGLTAQIAQNLNISQLPALNPGADAADKLAAGTAGIMMLIFSIVLETILILSAAIAIALGAFFLMVRLIALWILLILAPLAWIMSVLPATNHLFIKWWNNFLKWAFFAPIYAFFLYLAIESSRPTESSPQGAFTSIINNEMENIVNANGWDETIWSMMASSPKLFMQFLVVVGLLFGGVIVANSMSIYGAKGIMAMGAKAQKGAGDWAKRKALSAGARPAGAVGQWLSNQGNRMGLLGRGTGAAILARQGGRGFRSIEEKERAAVEAEKKKYDGYSDNNLKSTYKAVDARGQMAIAKVLAGRKNLKADDSLGFSGGDIEKTIKTAQRYGLEKDLIGARPELAANEKQSMEEMKDNIKRTASFKSVDLEKVQKESYAGNAGDGNRQEAYREVLNESITTEKGGMKPAALSKLAESNPELYIHIKDNIIKPIYQDPIKTAKFEKNRPDWTRFIEGEAGKALGLDHKKPVTSEQKAKAELEQRFGPVKAWQK